MLVSPESLISAHSLPGMHSVPRLKAARQQHHIFLICCMISPVNKHQVLFVFYPPAFDLHQKTTFTEHIEQLFSQLYEQPGPGYSLGCYSLSSYKQSKKPLVI